MVRLQCPQRSAWAAYSWEQPGGARGATERLPDLTLLVVAQRRTAGAYTCWAAENGSRWAVARYRLRQPDEAEAAPRDGGGRGEGGGTAAAPSPPPSAPRPRGSYWPHFVAVTALLALTLLAAAAVGAVSCRARSKVRGCGAAGGGGGGAGKAVLNGRGERSCCLQMDGGADPDDDGAAGSAR